MWHGRQAFEAGDVVEVRPNGRPDTWAPAVVVRVLPSSGTYDVKWFDTESLPPSKQSPASNRPPSSSSSNSRSSMSSAAGIAASKGETGVDKAHVRTPELHHTLACEYAAAVGMGADADSLALRLGGQKRLGSSSSSLSSSGGTEKKGSRRDAAASRLQAEWTAVSRDWAGGGLRRACDCEKLTTAEDWADWMRRLSVELLRHSPCPYVQPCAAIAEVYEPLAVDLFNAAFISVWNGLYTDERDNGVRDLALEDIPLVSALEAALKSPALPGPILTSILNLAEFMEMQGVPLPVDITLLGAAAQKMHAFAKALHYKEMAYEGMRRLQPPKTEDSSSGKRKFLSLQEVGLENCVEALISVNNDLELPDSAAGILASSGVRQKPALLEKLGRWEDAASLYAKAIADLTANPVPMPSKRSGGVVDGADNASELESSEEDNEDDDEAKTGSRSGASAKTSTSATAAQLLPAPLSPELVARAAKYRSWRASVVEAKLGALRCFDALGDLDGELAMAEDVKTFVDDSTPRSAKLRTAAADGTPSSAAKQNLFPGLANANAAWNREAQALGASAACSLQRWDLLKEDADLQKLLEEPRQHNASSSSGGAVSNGDDSSNSGENRSDSFGDGHGMAMGDRDRSIQNLMYAAMLALRESEFETAERCIGSARRQVAPFLATQLEESYGRAYPNMVSLQQFAELEEIVAFRRKEAELRRLHTPVVAEPLVAAAQSRLAGKWRQRLRHLVAPDISSWRRLVQVRSLVLDPTEDEATWLRLAALCRRSGSLALCGHTLRRLHVTPEAPPSFVKGADGVVRLLASGGDDLNTNNAGSGGAGGGGGVEVRPSARATLALFEYMWALGRRTAALTHLSAFTEDLDKQWKQQEQHRNVLRHSSMTSSATLFAATNNSSGGVGGGGTLTGPAAVDPKLLVKCLLKVAEWKRDDIAHGRTMVSATAPYSSSSSSSIAVSAVGGAAAIAATNESDRGAGSTSDSVSAPPNSSSGSSGTATPVTSALGEVLNLLARAKACRPNMYAAWHAWALTNHEAVKLAQRAHTDSTSATAKQACTSRQGEEEGRSNNENEGNGSNVMAPLAPSSGVGADTSFTYESVVAHVTSAISGFVRAIALGQAHSVSNVLQVHRCIIKKVFVV